jgi:hypothetical protein
MDLLVAQLGAYFIWHRFIFLAAASEKLQ